MYYRPNRMRFGAFFAPFADRFMESHVSGIQNAIKLHEDEKAAKGSKK